jgi:hypothetical protein
MTRFKNLVVNGDSYMEVYAQGNGQDDLADRLGIPCATSLAIGGSSDSRVIRTVMKHSYQATDPTFYILGVGFLSRWEVPVLKNEFEGSFEGRWTNPQNQDYKDRWEHNWNEKLTKQLMQLKIITDFYSVPDRLEDLMYRLMSLIGSLHSRGHRILVYQQADDIYQRYLDNLNLYLFKNNPIFIDGLRWRAVPWQIEQGVPTTAYGENPDYYVPPEIKHPAPGHHRVLNKFLHDYIVTHKILE